MFVRDHGSRVAPTDQMVYTWQRVSVILVICVGACGNWCDLPGDLPSNISKFRVRQKCPSTYILHVPLHYHLFQYVLLMPHLKYI